MDSLQRFNVRLAVFLVAALFAVVGIAAFWTIPFESVLRDFSTDDSFYFAGIARELAISGQSSFDGTTPTNGYQPLWTWLEVPVFWLGLDEQASIRTLRTLEVLLALAGFTALASALRYAGMQPWLALGMLVFFVGARELYEGMEAGTGIACLCVAAWTLARLAAAEAPQRAIRALVAGCALAICPLARLDNLAFTAAVTVLASMPGRYGLSIRGRPLVLLAAPPVLVALAYALWNQIHFGAPVPVSGLVKQWWSENMATDEGLGQLWRRLAGLWAHKPARDGILFGAIAAGFASRFLRRPPAGHAGARGFAVFVLGMLGLAVAKLLYYAATSEPALASYGWYFLTGPFTRYLAFVLAADWLLELARSRWPGLRSAAAQRVVTAAIVLVSLLLCGRELQHHARLVARTDDDWEILSWRGAGWLDDNTAPGTRIGSFDAGVLGFFSERRVTNLDGLVNSVEFYERMRNGGSIEEYLAEEGIDVVANVIDDGVAGFRGKGLSVGTDGAFTRRYVDARRAWVDSAWRRFAVVRRRP